MQRVAAGVGAVPVGPDHEPAPGHGVFLVGRPGGMGACRGEVAARAADIPAVDAVEGGGAVAVLGLRVDPSRADLPVGGVLDAGGVAQHDLRAADQIAQIGAATGGGDQHLGAFGCQQARARGQREHRRVAERGAGGDHHLAGDDAGQAVLVGGGDRQRVVASGDAGDVIDGVEAAERGAQHLDIAEPGHRGHGAALVGDGVAVDAQRAIDEGAIGGAVKREHRRVGDRHRHGERSTAAVVVGGHDHQGVAARAHDAGGDGEPVDIVAAAAETGAGVGSGQDGGGSAIEAAADRGDAIAGRGPCVDVDGAGGARGCGGEQRDRGVAHRDGAPHLLVAVGPHLDAGDDRVGPVGVGRGIPGDGRARGA